MEKKSWKFRINTLWFLIYLLPFCKGFSKSENPYYDVNKTLIYNTLKNITLFYMKFSGYYTLNTRINS